MAQPLVSIIIPTFNRAALIGETLKSVLAQTYKNWECIIVDDWSVEDTEKTVADFLLDTRIKFYRRPANRKKGASACRNYGLELAKGELIQFLDDDDLLSPEKLEEQVKSYYGGNELLICKWGGFTDPADFKSRFKYKYHSYRNFKKPINLLNSFGLYNEFFPPHVYLAPRQLIEKAGIWNEELTNNDDAEFFCRLILNAAQIKFIPDAQVYYRYGNKNKLSTINSSERIKSLVKSWQLVEEYILKKSSRYPLIYVKRAKHNLYKTFHKKSPLILNEYNNFFKDRKDYDNLWMNVYKRIKAILNL